MALKKNNPDAVGNRADEVFTKLNQSSGLGKGGKERMQTVSFQMRPTDYEELKKIFDELGLNAGSGIRYALAQFVRNYKKQQ